MSEGKIFSTEEEVVVRDDRGREIRAKSSGLTTHIAPGSSAEAAIIAAVATTFFASPGTGIPMRVKHRDPTQFATNGVDVFCSLIWGGQELSFRAGNTLAAGDFPGRAAVGDAEFDLFKAAATGNRYEYMFCSFPERVSAHPSDDRFVATIGSMSNPITIRVKYVMDAGALSADAFVGFRKGVAVPINKTSFTDYAGLSNSFGNIFQQTRLNTGTPTSVDTTYDHASDASVEYQVTLETDGTISAQVNGNAITPPSFTFDSGDEIFPVIYFENDSGGNGGMYLEELEVKVG